MALINQGILGGFRKKVGKVVGAHWRGLDTIRALPRSSGKAPTQAQLNQTAKFGLVTGFLSRMSPLIEIGFKDGSRGATPMNQAVAYHLKEAITGLEPNFEIDYAKVKFSRGNLELNAIDMGITALTLNFNWGFQGPDDKFFDGTDAATILIFNPAKDRFLRKMNAAARSETLCTFDLPADYGSDTLHVYFAFFSTKKKGLVSETLYLGTIVVNP